jgi:hypothetical protein
LSITVDLPEGSLIPSIIQLQSRMWDPTFRVPSGHSDNMPNASALIRRLTELRKTYTGEGDSAALPSICSGTKELGFDDRARLLDALEGHARSPLPSRIRQAVLPDTTSQAQQHLEAGILRAASRMAPLRVFRMVRPFQDGLSLHILPSALPALLRELMPRMSDNGIVGFPGLRARSHRRHVVLTLLDIATVQLTGVSYRQWLEAVDIADDDRTPQDPLRWLGNDPSPLTSPECALLAANQCSAVATASALLRRIRLFPVMPTQTTVTEACHLSWSVGPSVLAVADRLLHPVTGLGDIRPNLLMLNRDLPKAVV